MALADGVVFYDTLSKVKTQQQGRESAQGGGDRCEIAHHAAAKVCPDRLQTKRVA
jgi:hypothetical protein